MARTRFAAEQIIHQLKEAEVDSLQGRTTAEICGKLEISEQNHYPDGTPIDMGTHLS